MTDSIESRCEKLLVQAERFVEGDQFHAATDRARSALALATEAEASAEYVRFLEEEIARYEAIEASWRTDIKARRQRQRVLDNDRVGYGPPVKLE